MEGGREEGGGREERGREGGKGERGREGGSLVSRPSHPSICRLLRATNAGVRGPGYEARREERREGRTDNFK